MTSLNAQRDQTRKTFQMKIKELRRTTALRQKMTTLDRKRDAHEKIRLGGLIIKAELHNEDKDVILGLLAQAKEALLSDTTEATRQSYKYTGKKLWDDHDELKKRGQINVE